MQLRPRYTCSPLALFALVLCQGACAQTSVPAVEISARAGTTDTASKTIITSADIRRHGETNLLDVLKRVPGLSVAGGLRMRGLGEGYLQILLNGEAAPPGFSIDSLAPEAVERIEISRAASAEHGGRGIAGTINVVLRRIVRKDQRDLRLSVADEHGQPGARASLNLSGRSGKLSHVLAGGAAHGRSVRDSSMTDIATGSRPGASETVRVDQARSDTLDFSPRLTWQLGGGDTLAWQSFMQLQRRANVGAATSDALYGPPPIYAAMQTRSASDVRLARSSVNWVHQLERQARLELSVGVTGARRRQQARFVGGDESGQAISGRDVATRATDRGLTNKGKYSFPADAFHTVVFGWEGAVNGRDEARQVRTLAQQAAPTESENDASVRVRRLSGFVQDEWSLGRGWSVYVGLSWEQVSTVSAGSDADQVSNRYAVWSPIVQTLWKVPESPGSQLRLALSRTYQAPTPQTLIGRRIVAADNKASSPDYQGNPYLRPTLSWGADLGLEHDFGRGVTVSGNAYARRLSDLAGRSLFLQDGRWVAMMANNGSATVRGIDLDARLARGFAGGAVRSLEVRANVARNWSSVDNVRGPYNRLDGQTPVSANLGIDLGLRPVALALGANFHFQNGGTVANSDQESAWSSASRTLDLFGVWSLDKRSKVRLSLDNALAQPAEMQSTLREGGDEQMQTVRAASGRTVRLSWEYSGW